MTSQSPNHAEARAREALAAEYRASNFMAFAGTPGGITYRRDEAAIRAMLAFATPQPDNIPCAGAEREAWSAVGSHEADAEWVKEIAALELSEDGLSLRTAYDGDADGDGRSIIVGGEVIATFEDSSFGEAVRDFLMHSARAALAIPQPSPPADDEVKEMVSIEGNQIVMRVPISAVRDAAGYAFEDAWGQHNIEVIDEAEFAKELVTELRRERENGATMIHDMLDKACVRAAENGALGLSDDAALTTTPNGEAGK